MRVKLFDTYNQVIRGDEYANTITTSIGMASMRTAQKIIEIYED